MRRPGSNSVISMSAGTRLPPGPFTACAYRAPTPLPETRLSSRTPLRQRVSFSGSARKLKTSSGGRAITISFAALGIGHLARLEECAELFQAAPPAFVVHLHGAGSHEVVVHQ